jgi:hypothetical protein
MRLNPPDDAHKSASSHPGTDVVCLSGLKIETAYEMKLWFQWFTLREIKRKFWEAWSISNKSLFTDLRRRNYLASSGKKAELLQSHLICLPMIGSVFHRSKVALRHVYKRALTAVVHGGRPSILFEHGQPRMYVELLNVELTIVLLLHRLLQIISCLSFCKVSLMRSLTSGMTKLELSLADVPSCVVSNVGEVRVASWVDATPTL